MAEQKYTWSAWIAGADGYYKGELDANGVSEPISEFAARVAAKGDTATEKGPNPAATRPADRPLTAEQQAVVTKRDRLAVLRSKAWSALTKAQQTEATDLAFVLKEPVPGITAIS